MLKWFLLLMILHDSASHDGFPSRNLSKASNNAVEQSEKELSDPIKSHIRKERHTNKDGKMAAANKTIEVNQNITYNCGLCFCPYGKTHNEKKCVEFCPPCNNIEVDENLPVIFVSETWTCDLCSCPYDKDVNHEECSKHCLPCPVSTSTSGDRLQIITLNNEIQDCDLCVCPYNDITNVNREKCVEFCPTCQIVGVGENSAVADKDLTGVGENHIVADKDLIGVGENSIVADKGLIGVDKNSTVVDDSHTSYYVYFFLLLLVCVIFVFIMLKRKSKVRRRRMLSSLNY